MKQYVHVRWSPLDVMAEAENRGIEITRKQAADLLRKIETQLKDAMLRAGWWVIEEAVRELEEQECQQQSR